MAIAQTGLALAPTAALERSGRLVRRARLLLCLGANALLGWWWADPVTALALAAVAAREGLTAWRGESCCAACHGRA